MGKRIHKILIANRGEIVSRIARTLRELNYRMVIIYTREDRDLEYVRQANEAVILEGDTLEKTYLNIPLLIDIAKKTGCDAIHPGYGFLSENPAFASAAEKNNIVFLGPSSGTIRIMGDKIEAREYAREAGIPLANSHYGTPRELLSKIEEIQFPVLIKAAAGGGGKGMKIVQDTNEIEDALEATAREAENYFGDKRVYIEEYLTDNRHIEVQVLGDGNGNVIHLFERECSLQRRYQKIVEEAPSPTLNNKQREEVTGYAVQLARSIQYRSAGTVEFLMDKNGKFYFLEMNTRLQVEHPVTEMITGLDIIAEQIFIAEKDHLRLKQEDVNFSGHAIEARVYTEDTELNFIPSPGEIEIYQLPGKRQARIDTALLQPAVISGKFDPMIAKVIAHGTSRIDAIKILKQDLDNYHVGGIKTNIAFLTTILNHPDFQENMITTNYIDNKLPRITEAVSRRKQAIDRLIPLAGLISLWLKGENVSISKKTLSPWTISGYWRILMQKEFILNKESINIEIYHNAPDSFSMLHDEKEIDVSDIQISDGMIQFSLNHQQYSMAYKIHEEFIRVVYLNYPWELQDATFHQLEISMKKKKNEREEMNGNIIYSPLHGKIIKVNVKEAQEVKKGDVLLIIEAMKMENNVIAPRNSTVNHISAIPGQQVQKNTPLVTLN